jgi:hypothetical protein
MGDALECQNRWFRIARLPIGKNVSSGCFSKACVLIAQIHSQVPVDGIDAHRRSRARRSVTRNSQPPDAPLTPVVGARMVRAENRRGRAWMCRNWSDESS